MNMKTYVNRLGSEEFPRWIVVNDDHEVWDGDAWGEVQCGLLYAHRGLAEADGARIAADQQLP